MLCFLGPFAILFAVLALLDIRKNPRKGGTVRAVVGILGGLLGLALLLLFLVAAVFG